MEFDPATLPWQSVYKLLTGAILPRPIGWISTVNPAGQPNLAPFSFFNVAGANPAHVLFCPMIRTGTRQPKDTLRNVRDTGEFVVNIFGEDLLHAMNLTSGEWPPEVNEFELAGLSKAPSLHVRPPRVAESPMHLECQVTQIVDLGDQPGGSSVVIGRVLHIHVSEDILIGEDKINLQALRPVGRLVGNGYCRVAPAMFDLARP